MFPGGDNKRVVVKTKCMNSLRACGVPLTGRVRAEYSCSCLRGLCPVRYTMGPGYREVLRYPKRFEEAAASDAAVMTSKYFQ